MCWRCFRSWAWGQHWVPCLAPAPAHPEGSSLTGADQWGSAAPRAPPRRVSRTPLKLLQNIVCACVCASATGPCRKGACLECLLTCSLVSITHQSRVLIHQAFCSRDTATFSAGMDGSSTASQNVPAWAISRVQTVLFHAEILGASGALSELVAWALLCEAPTDGCGLSFLSASSPAPLPTSKAQTWPGWWDFGVTTRRGTKAPSSLPNERHHRGCGLPGGCEDLLPAPAWTLPPPYLWGVLRAANPDDLGHVRMWSWNKWVSAVRVWP